MVYSRMPLGSMVMVLTWLRAPGAGSLLPLNEISKAPAFPVLITILSRAPTDFSADALSVPCMICRPSAVMVTQESSRALICTRKAPGTGTEAAVAEVEGAEGEGAETGTWVCAVAVGVVDGGCGADELPSATGAAEASDAADSGWADADRKSVV